MEFVDLQFPVSTLTVAFKSRLSPCHLSQQVDQLNFLACPMMFAYSWFGLPSMVNISFMMSNTTIRGVLAKQAQVFHQRRIYCRKCCISRMTQLCSNSRCIAPDCWREEIIAFFGGDLQCGDLGRSVPSMLQIRKPEFRRSLLAVTNQSSHVVKPSAGTCHCQTMRLLAP